MVDTCKSHKTNCKISFSIFPTNKAYPSGPGCSKLTTSLVNVSLKVRKLISEICQYFCRKNVRSLCSAKDSLIFSTKNISVFVYKVLKPLTSLVNVSLKVRKLISEICQYFC